MLHHFGVASCHGQHAGMASWNPEGYERLRLQLVKARRKRSLSQTQVAEALGVPQQHISRVETGDRRIDPTELQLFAQLYGVPLREFFGRE